MIIILSMQALLVTFQSQDTDCKVCTTL